MKIKGVLLIVLFVFVSGCSLTEHALSDEDTWGGRNQINSQDVEQIVIENGEGETAKLTTPTQITGFIKALKQGVFDPGVLDIRVPDFIVTLHLKNGVEKNIQLWLVNGANLFTDSDDDGHYTLTEDARNQLVEFIKEVGLWNEQKTWITKSLSN